MAILRLLLLVVLAALIGSSGVCDQVVWQEDFSGAFIQHQWIYNNSGPERSNTGYDGQPWIGTVSNNGREILGYDPTRYYWTTFQNFSVGPLVGDGWVGTGEVVQPGNDPDPNTDSPTINSQCVRFRGGSAYRNVTSGMQGQKQWIQFFMKMGEANSSASIYVGTQDIADVAVAIRLTFDSFAYNYIVEALDGDEAGAGTWTVIGRCWAGSWYRVLLELDYSNSEYTANIHKCGVVSGLGFRDANAATGLGAVKFEQPDGSGYLYIDDLFAANSPYANDPQGRQYWSEHFNHRCVSYGEELNETRDIYPWMVYTNTAADAPLPLYASLPAGWTAAFGMWADWDPNSAYWSSGRGKMGFGRYIGPYGQSPTNPCLNVWSSHGDMRVVGPNITTGPGIYTLSWKMGVWNGNTANPNMQYKWTDWCSWGYGYTNWSPWDLDAITMPPYTADQVNQISISRYWTWVGDPFHDSDPDGVINNRPDNQHPANEQPGQWHSYSRTFAFGLAPEKGQDSYDFNQDPGYFVGFRVAHAHDEHNAGYRWTTIANIDDIVLTKKDPVAPKDAKVLPPGSLVEVRDMVIANMIPPDFYTHNWVDIFLESEDRSGAILFRSYEYGNLWDSYYEDFKFQIGQKVSAVGAIHHTEAGVAHITDNYQAGSRLPALFATAGDPVDLKPVGINQRDLVGRPLTEGLNNDGMLVTVVGKLNNVMWAYDPTFFFVDDGSGLDGGET